MLTSDKDEINYLKYTYYPNKCNTYKIGIDFYKLNEFII